jgi:prophage regulatory protein
MSKRIIRLPAVRQKVGKCSSGIYQGVKDGTFPAPIKLSELGRAVGWLEGEIDDWIDQRIKASRSEVDNA